MTPGAEVLYVGTLQYKSKINIYYFLKLSIIFFTFMAMCQHKNLCPGSHGNNDLNRNCLGHNYYKVSLSEPCPRLKKMILKELMHN